MSRLRIVLGSATLAGYPEGGGVEALARGLPVLTYNKGSVTNGAKIRGFRDVFLGGVF